jgi:hypothetical protein
MRAAKVSRRHAKWVIDDTAHQQAAVAVRKRARPRGRGLQLAQEPVFLPAPAWTALECAATSAAVRMPPHGRQYVVSGPQASRPRRPAHRTAVTQNM